MTAKTLDGRKLSATLRKDLKAEVAEFVAEGARPPGLAVILVGSDPASEVYVGRKRDACAEVGIVSHAVNCPADVTQEELLSHVDAFNDDPEVDGILVQLPLPPQIDPAVIIERIRPDKDVDGFHPYNIGRLAQRVPLLRPCTPSGIMQLLELSGETYKGRHAVIVGASNIVGRPMALELLLAGATVTITHRFTQNLRAEVERADIVIVAVGKPGLVPGEWIRPGATVIDVGITRGEDGGLRGDVGYDEAKKRAAWITPVPGGVGPMTVAVLMQNTVEAWHRHRDASAS